MRHSAERVMRAACDELGTTVERLFGGRPDLGMGVCKKPGFCAKRAIVCAVTREISQASWPEISRAAGRSTHTTAYSAARLADRGAVDAVSRAVAARLSDGRLPCRRGDDDAPVPALHEPLLGQEPAPRHADKR